VARIVFSITANAAAAVKAFNTTRSAIEQARQSLRGATIDAGKVALGMIGAQSATAALRSGMRALTSGVRAYLDQDDRAAAQARATAAAYDALRASIGEAILGGENATSVFGVLQGVADRLREAVQRNQETVQAFVREALARAVEAFARVIEIGGALVQTYTLVRGATLLLAGAIRGALIAAMAVGAEAMASLRDVGSSLVEGLADVLAGVAHLARQVGQRGLASQLERGAEGLRGFGAAGRETTERMRLFASEGMAAATQSIEEGRAAYAEAVDTMVARQGEIDRITGGIRDLAQGMREGTISARELREELARPRGRAGAVDTGAERLAEQLRAQAEQARRALLSVSARLAEDRQRLADEYGAGVVQSEADAQREIMAIAKRGTEGLTEEEVRRAHARLGILRSFLSSAADVETEAARRMAAGEAIRSGAEDLRRSLLGTQQRYQEDSLALAQAYGVARVGVEFDTAAAIRDLLAVDYASLTEQEQAQYAARLDALRSFEASRSTILEEEEARRLAVEAEAARRREDIQRRLQSATQRVLADSLRGGRRMLQSALQIIGDELLGEGVAAIFRGGIRNAALPGSGLPLIGAGIAAQAAARGLGARRSGVSAGSQAPASGADPRAGQQVTQNISLSAMMLDDAALQRLGTAMRESQQRGYA
jgi:hypothetical protein